MTEQIETLWDKIQSLEERIELLEKSNGSKGSDEISKVAENTSFDNLPKVQNKDSFGDTSSQTEISDEEIEKSAKEWYDKKGIVHYKAEIRAWVSACKWYREQLKTKQ